MPAKRLPMRQIREVLRLRHAAGLSDRRIADALRISRYSVAEYVRRAAAAGIGWPAAAGVDDAALEARLFGPAFLPPGASRPLPDWSRVRAELSRDSVTLLLLWEEYRDAHPDGVGYSWFCDLYKEWLAGVSPVMRQAHPAGERLFVDYAGSTVPVTDPMTGEVRTAQIFVAALGASNLTYAEARWTQGLADWIACHVNAFAFYGGVSRQVVCDNLKAGVTAACRYEPGINRTYQDMAAHYGTAILPTRPRKPRDKAKAEVAVQVVQRWILARLRNRRFFSLGELNEAVRALTADVNNRPMRRVDQSRRELFDAIERPALLALPAEPFEYAEWKRCRLAPDYHVEVHGHWYSAPWKLIRQVLDARITDRTVELFHRGTRVAVHARSPVPHRHTTVAEHMPEAHRRYAGWTPELIRRDAGRVGPATLGLVEAIFRSKRHPEQGVRACLGILRLRKAYGEERLEAACQRGLDIGARGYGSIVSILRNNLDRAYRLESVPDTPPVPHGNIRGGGYYH